MTIWEKVSNIIEKEFNSELVYNKKYLKAKKINTKERFHWVYAQVILIDSVYRKDENYYPKVFLEKYNLITTEEKMSIFNDNVKIYSNDSDEEYSDDSGDSDEEKSDRKIRMTKIRCINLFNKNTRKI